MARLYYFSPEAFLSPDPQEQGACDLVLSLALIYNDIRDVLAIIHHLKQVAPPQGISPNTGEYWGMLEHQYRRLVSILYEIFYLIRQRPQDIEHKLFIRVELQLNREARSRWTELKAAAIDDPHAGLGDFKLLAKTVRNDLGHHYVDTKEIGKGFRYFFTSPHSQGQEGCYVSLSPGMEGSRYYFADAAAQGYMRTLLGNKGSAEEMRYAQDITSCAKSARDAISGIVLAFLSVRNASLGESRHSQDARSRQAGSADATPN